MKIVQTLILFLGILGTVNASSGEIFQLKSIHSTVEEDKINKYTAEELLEKEKGKTFIVNFLKMTFEEKYKMTTSNYKKIFKNADSLKKGFDKESYEKIDFVKTDLVDKGKGLHMTIKANVYWFIEGYDGISTIYFMLEKVKGEWLLDWLVF